MTSGERELICTDQFEWLMANRVQTVKETTIPPWTEVALSCRVMSHNHPPEGLTENLSDKVVLAKSINRPGDKEMASYVASTLPTNLWNWQQGSPLEPLPVSVNRT